MKLTIDEHDLKEIDNNLYDLTGWLTSHFSSFNACAFVLQSIIDATDKMKEQLKETGENENGK